MRARIGDGVCSHKGINNENKVDKSGKDNIKFIIAGKNTAKSFEASKEPFDLITLFVQLLIMLVAIPPHMSVAQYMGYLKSKSSLMIFDRHANLKYKYGNRHFWCRGYYVDTVGKYEGAIREYIQNQLQEDMMNDQISLKEYVDPFTGVPVKQGK